MASLKALLNALPASLLGVAAMNVLFVGLMVTAAGIPAEPVRGEVATSYQQAVLSDVDYPVALDPQHPTDLFTECVGISIATDARPEGLVATALAPHWVSNAEHKNCQALKDFVQQRREGLVENTYYRYWHGYAVFFKMGLRWLSFANLRLVMCALFVLSLMVASLSCAQATKSTTTGLALFAPILFFTDWHSLMHMVTAALPFATALFGFTFIVSRRNTHVTLRRVMLWSALPAAIFCFVDFLSSPPLCASLFVFATLLLAYQRGLPNALTAQWLIASSLGWCVGYACTFIWKQIFTALLLPEAHVFQQFYEALLFRLGITEYPSVDRALFAALSAVIAHTEQFSIFTKTTTLSVFAAATLAFACRCASLWRQYGLRAAQALLLALFPAVVPLIWYEVYSNHTQIHAQLFMGRYAYLMAAMLASATALSFGDLWQRYRIRQSDGPHENLTVRAGTLSDRVENQRRHHRHAGANH